MARNWYLTVLVLAGIGSCWSQSKTTVSDPCSKLTCYNGGTCVRRWESYATCVCKGGYTGTYCQYWVPTTTPSARRTTYPNYCAGVKCQNGGSCMNSDSGFWYCVCQPFTSGKYCEYKMDKPKETTVATLSPAICGGIQCKNGGSCQLTDSGYAYCICQIPYNGRLCENKASVNYTETTTWSTAPTKYPNYCASIWCQNGGTCYNSDSGYGYCVCQPLTTGKYCEYYYGPDGQKTTTVASFYKSTPRYDPCVSNPCLNGGTCKSYSYSYSDYYCTCPSYASGRRCQLSSVQEPPCKLRYIDFKWDDLEKFENVTETMCQQYCSADGRCQYWSYRQYWNVCWTKSSSNQYSELPGRIENNWSVVSGFKKCPGDCEFRETDFPGNDLDIMGVPVDYTYASYSSGNEECQRLCAETAECQFWSLSYVSGAQRCFRKRSATGLPSRVTDKPGTISGFKSCPNGFHSLSQNDGYGPHFGK